MFTQTTNAQTSSSLDKTWTTTLGFHLVSKNDGDDDDDDVSKFLKRPERSVDTFHAVQAVLAEARSI